MTGTELSTLRSLPDVVAEYDAKRAALPEAIATFEAAGRALHVAASVGGEYGQETIDTGRGVYLSTLERNLLRSAWMHVWKGLNLPQIASAKDKKSWEVAMASPAPFTLDNLRATFGPYLENPRTTILRGLAEVFADLDPAYKSHEKVKIGVKGLPKRVILNGFGDWSSYGTNKLHDIMRALAAYRGEPMVEWSEVRACTDEARKRGEADWRGGYMRLFQNGNAHLFFDAMALIDINRALAEFYGDVLPDSPEADAERPAPRAPGTAVSKDLQFYPTPKAVIDRVIADLGDLRGQRVLEPSCGDGRIMDALRDKGADVTGVEVDRARADATRAKGHKILCDNFLRVDTSMGWHSFDIVVMNPPFYGKHYAKHVRHALRFLKPGGTLTAILPATARYDHGLLDDLNPSWTDLPVGAFAESGTNVCTTICTIQLSRGRR
ncbi:MAG: DUF4942 domain-containing protein [Desulfurellales bacterium]|nr:MAG: DUF4942 domain-containing protein [Desulfurellales bacterium]